MTRKYRICYTMINPPIIGGEPSSLCDGCEKYIYDTKEEAEAKVMSYDNSCEFFYYWVQREPYLVMVGRYLLTWLKTQF